MPNIDVSFREYSRFYPKDSFYWIWRKSWNIVIVAVPWFTQLAVTPEPRPASTGGLWRLSGGRQLAPAGWGTCPQYTGDSATDSVREPWPPRSAPKRQNRLSNYHLHPVLLIEIVLWGLLQVCRITVIKNTFLPRTLEFNLFRLCESPQSPGYHALGRFSCQSYVFVLYGLEQVSRLHRAPNSHPSQVWHVRLATVEWFLLVSLPSAVKGVYTGVKRTLYSGFSLHFFVLTEKQSNWEFDLTE